MRRQISVFFAALGAFFIFSPIQASAYTLPQYDQTTGYLTTQTFTASGSPYILPAGCENNRLPVGATLTLEAGVVVKFASPRNCGWSPVQARLQVYGDLIVKGAAEAPVIFTAWEDDTAGGDTNSDGSNTSPQAGAWERIQFGGQLASSTVFVQHAEFRYGGMIQINPNGILNLRLDNIAVASSSGWGIQTYVPMEIHNSRFFGNGQGAIDADPSDGNFLPRVDAANNWWGDDSEPRVQAKKTKAKGQTFRGNIVYDPWIGKEEKLDPVIIIPGIMGSSDKNGKWVIDPIFHTYDDLVDTLLANGYTEGKDLFTFPYDWRASNAETARLLEQKIQRVKRTCKCAKADLVAHSMGGLVARQYIQSDRYKGDVDQLIFLGTPHLGAPDAYLMWEGGVNSPSLIHKGIEFLFTKEAKHSGFSNLFDYVRNRPILSVQELLPIFDYIRDKDSGIVRIYPTTPRNQFLERLHYTSTTLSNSKVRITNIVGDLGPSSTMQILRVVASGALPLWEDGYPDGFNERRGDYGLELGNGDKTVPKNSGEFIKSDLHVLQSEHRDLVTDAAGIIVKKLTGIDPKILVRRNIPSIDFKLLILKILSPVDVQIVAPDGKRIGKNFATGREINEIDGAFYSGFSGDNEYVTVPNPLDGEYKVVAQGTGAGGEYTVSAGYISEDAVVKRDFTAKIEPGRKTDIRLDAKKNTAENTAGGISFRVAEDILPPEIRLLAPCCTRYTRSDIMPVVADVADADTGVQSLWIRFDDALAQTGDAIDLFKYSPGEHTLSVVARDWAGNTITSTNRVEISVTADSVADTVERSFAAGWIARRTVKDDLMSAVLRAARLERRLEEIREEMPNRPRIARKVERIERGIDRALGQAFLERLESHFISGRVNEQAYKILKEDVAWLLSH